MCGSMVDIQSATAEIRRGKKKTERRKKKPQDENIMSASASRAAIKIIIILKVQYDLTCVKSTVKS